MEERDNAEGISGKTGPCKRLQFKIKIQYKSLNCLS